MHLVDGKYSINWEDLESRISVDTHSLILCNPQNPTGNYWSEEDLLRLGRMCLEHRIVVLADEIHCDFVMKGQTYTPFASLPDKDVVNNSLTFKAASKTFSLAAMKNAWFFSTNPDYLQRVRVHHRPNSCIPPHATRRSGRRLQRAAPARYRPARENLFVECAVEAPARDEGDQTSCPLPEGHEPLSRNRSTSAVVSSQLATSISSRFVPAAVKE